MNTSLAAPRRSRKSPRCQHRSAAGSRCRAIPSSGSPFCAAHAKAATERREAEQIASILIGGLDQFSSAASINQFLSRLLLLLAQDRLSPRRGAVLAYTANLILRSLTVMDRQASAEQAPENRTVQFVWDIPRPNHARARAETQATPTAGEIAPEKTLGKAT